MYTEEAHVFSAYLLKQEVSEEILLRYSDACKKLNLTGNTSEEKTIKTIIRNPGLLPFADAALAFGNGKHLLRRKLFIMLAILETCPEFYSHFNTQEKSSGKWLAFFFRGCSAVFKMVIGKIILLFI